MTKQAFAKLQVRDAVCIGGIRPNDRALCTVVLSIDRFFGKVTVLCGRKAYSYRYVQSKIGNRPSGLCVGLEDF